MKLILAALPILALTACTTSQDDSYGAGFVTVSESTWVSGNDTPYPFTVPNGEISCTEHPKFGRTIYFEPEGFTDESRIGAPLNQAAADALKADGLAPNVPYSIKRDADLREAQAIGMRVCDEQRDLVGS